MKKCPFCSADIEESARFCLYCMQSLTEKEQVVPAQKKKPQWWLIIAAVFAAFLILVLTLLPSLSGSKIPSDYSQFDATSSSNCTEPSEPLYVGGDSSAPTDTTNESTYTAVTTALASNGSTDAAVTTAPATNGSADAVVTTAPATNGSGNSASITTDAKLPVTTTSSEKVSTSATTAVPTTTVTTAKPAEPAVHLSESEKAMYQNIVDTENAWLAKLQLPNGAIPHIRNTNGVVKVTPYFADLAALSLLNQPELYKDHVKQYMDWHFSHLNTAETDINGVDGTIYNYNILVGNGVVENESILVLDGKNHYDSTDNYAATFLMVLQKYAEKTGDTAYIIDNKLDIERIINAMFATMNNGLTMAKPDECIKYLSNNCEVYAGMLAGAKLYTDVLIPAGKGTVAMRDKLATGAKLVAEHIEKDMWAGEYYNSGIKEDYTATPQVFKWTTYHPSATAQTFPILYGLLSPDSARAKTLYSYFCYYYQWEYFDIPDFFYWGSNVYTAVMMGDVDRVKAYMTKYEKVVMKRHAYPLYNADAARVAMAAYLMLEQFG